MITPEEIAKPNDIEHMTKVLIEIEAQTALAESIEKSRVEGIAGIAVCKDREARAWQEHNARIGYLAVRLVSRIPAILAEIEWLRKENDVLRKRNPITGIAELLPIDEALSDESSRMLAEIHRDNVKKRPILKPQGDAT